MIVRVLTFLVFFVIWSDAAVIRMPITTGPFGGSQLLTLTDNAGATIGLSGRNICTDDIPTSSCFTSAIVTGGGAVEFLLSDRGSVLRLSEGAVLSDQPASGMWGVNILNRYEFLISRSSPRDGTFTPLNSKYSIAFRVSETGGGYRYGWLEAKPHSSGLGTTFNSLALSDGVTNSLAVTPIPEPTSPLFLTFAALTLLWRTRRHTQSLTAP